jgi:5-methyltetrahydrofolate--homocysteine methyltransferase
METVLKGRKGILHIAPDCPTVLIGKRVGPTRHKRPAGEPVVGQVEIVKNEALAQVAAGADVVNVSVKAAGADEVTLLPRAVETVQEAVEVPISIETPNLAALAAALEACQGKPLVNSVNGEKKRLSQVLPLVAERGAAVIGLCVDEEEGVPDDPDRRLEIACQIVEQAEALGIPREDILIDCLTHAVEADRGAALVTLETIRLVRAELGVNMTLDISAISSELPNRSALHQAFLNMAIVEGVNAPIINVARDRQTILALDVLLGRDKSAARYIRYYHYQRSGMRSLVDWELIGW